MAKGGKTQKHEGAEPFEFPLFVRKQHEARRRELAFADSETLRYEFQRLKDKIDWEALRLSKTEEQVNAALSRLDEFDRNRLPSSRAILATIQDPKYPKLRPISFLATSCALAMRDRPNSAEVYSARYSRDICYGERKRRGRPPKPISDLEYWLGQAKAGQRVPSKYRRRIDKLLAQQQRRSGAQKIRRELTYVDIHEKIEGMKKKRTTVWLPEATVAKLKKLSVTTGAPMAELFRRAVEAYLSGS